MVVCFAKTNGGELATNSPQGPGSRAVSFSNGSLRFTLAGALPNTSCFTNSSEAVYIDGSGTYWLSRLTTDANGNGNSSFPWGTLSPDGDLFQVVPQNAAGMLWAPASLAASRCPIECGDHAKPLRR